MITEDFCKRCSHYAGCGFISRNLQTKCDILQIFEEGYEQGYEDAIKKACEYLEEYTPQKFEDVQNYVENFCKAMEGE